MKNSRLKNDNKGFSLIELIVTVLITSILMLAVTMFISSSRSTYQMVNTSATLQEEALIAERVFTEAFMEAKAYSYEEGVDLVSGVSTDLIWIKAKENDPVSGDTNPDDSVYCFVIDKTDNQIRYYKDTHNLSGTLLGDSLTTEGKNNLIAGCFGTNAKFSMVSKNVKSVDLDKISRTDGTDLVCMKIVFEYLGKEYNQNITVVTRNLIYTTTPTTDPTTDPGTDPD